MKRLLFALLSFLVISPYGFSQNIILEVDGDDLYYSESGCADCTPFGIDLGDDPDPRWRNRLLINSGNYDWNADRDNVSCGWQGITNYGWYNPAVVGYGTTVSMQMNGYEADGGLCGDDDNVCGGYSTRRTITSTDYVPCQWQYFTDTRDCGGGDYRVEWSIYWRYALSPTLTGATPAAQVRCQGAAPATLTATCNTDAAGRPLARWYKWQISNTPNGPWSDVPGTQNASANTSATSFSLTPGQISGTRYYRFVANSNCTSDYNNYSSTSSVSEVTYAFPASGSYTNQGSWPFGTGDAAPNVINSLCGQTVLPGQQLTFNALIEPNAGAAANYTSLTWSASGGSPASAAGTSFTWTAPTTTGIYNITLTYTFGGCTTASTTCTITVGAPTCDFAYVSPSGSNVTTAGGPNNPYQTISYALTQLAGRTYIRVASGTITEPGIVNIPNGVTIEGGYQITANGWVKNSSVTTTINCGALESIDANTGHTIGFKSISTSNNWTLQDLTIVTVDATGQTSNGRGRSSYGIWINGSTGYNIIRCVINPGDGSIGSNGSTPGGSGSAGGGGGGGSGGSGANGCGNPGAGTKGANGNGGAVGGNGSDIGGASGCSFINLSSCSAARPGKASTGSNGAPGSSFTAGVRPTTPNPTNAAYYTPGGQASPGGNGFGGGGGGGGGGSRGGSVLV